MFSGLRQGAPFYVLNKQGEKPTLRTAQVTAVSNPQPKFGQSQPYGTAPETVVDVSVKYEDGTTENFNQLPSSLSIANFGANGIVVSESREAMAQEVDNMRRTSQSVIDSMDYHCAVIDACEAMASVLNPHIAKERVQEQKIAGLETKINGMEGTLSNIQQMLSDVLSKNTNHKQ